MKLKLRLLKDDKVVFEIPLSADDWSRKRLENELALFEEDHERFTRLFDALSHETRLRMMTRLFGDDDLTLSFADFMKDLDLNPKIVWESTRKLREGGLLTKSPDGKYRPSDPAVAEFLMVSLALRRLLKAIDEL
jgi:DNA-binding transcriptional ArsR family regulator